VAVIARARQVATGSKLSGRQSFRLLWASSKPLSAAVLGWAALDAVDGPLVVGALGFVVGAIPAAVRDGMSSAAGHRLVAALVIAALLYAVSLILDPVGGKSWSTGYDLLAPCGRLVAFGLSSAASGKKRSLLHAAAQVLKVKKWSPMKLMDDNKTVAGTNMGHLFGRLDLLRPQFEALLAMYEAGQIAPHVDRTFSFAEAAAAHHFIHDRKAIGKVLLVP